jgi:hypothetical protein
VSPRKTPLRQAITTSSYTTTLTKSTLRRLIEDTYIESGTNKSFFISIRPSVNKLVSVFPIICNRSLKDEARRLRKVATDHQGNLRSRTTLRKLRKSRILWTPKRSVLPIGESALLMNSFGLADNSLVLAILLSQQLYIIRLTGLTSGGKLEFTLLTTYSRKTYFLST